MRCCSERGQATLEAAIVFPLLLGIFGAFLQPVVLLYDRAVMASAAAETCRVLETQTASDEAVQAFALRRLGAVPQVSMFHVGGNDGWTVELVGGELADEVTVTVTHSVDPLPLLGVTAGLVANMQADGTCEQTVTASSALAPQWASALDDGPDEWLEAWE